MPIYYASPLIQIYLMHGRLKSRASKNAPESYTAKMPRHAMTSIRRKPTLMPLLMNMACSRVAANAAAQTSIAPAASPERANLATGSNQACAPLVLR